MEKFQGIYLGIVVQNNDPEKRGRIKIYVPQVSASVYNKWDRTNTDKKFKFPGINISSPLSDIIKALKDVLPWAEYAGPIMGASGSGRYSAFTDFATVSDSNVASQRIPSTPSNLFAKYKANPEGIGEKPGNKHQTIPVVDAFTNTTNGGSKINPAGNNYTPSSYSNTGKGCFSIPNVGSHVWCFFENSNHMRPVYFAVAHGADDFAGVYDNGLDYPGANENKDSRDSLPNNPNLDTYRNKFVFNQKGGAIEIVNTDNREAVKINHYSGSFIEFNNFTTTRLATNNDQLVVKKDQFKTVYGNESCYVGFDSEKIIKGDSIKKIGSMNADAFNAWLSAVAPVNAARVSPSATASSIASAVNGATSALLLAEQDMGNGGNDFTFVTKHQTEVVGAAINNLNSLKVTAAGNTLDAIIGPGVSVVQQPFDKIERARVDDMPGGTRSTTIGNRWNVIIGAGGFNLKTYGPVDISGTSVAVAGEQTVIAAEKELTIDSKNYMAIASKILVLKAKSDGQVLISKSGLGIERNVTVAGGMHVQGNLSCGQIHAPMAIHVTEETSFVGTAIQIINAVGPWPGTATISGTIGAMLPHTHRFRTISQNYNVGIAANAAACANNATPVAAGAPTTIAGPIIPNGPIPGFLP